MKTELSVEDWTIYNCHIHTFTKKNTPRNFIKFVLADSKIGRISGKKIFLALLFVVPYLSLILFLAKILLRFPSNLSIFSLPVFSFLLLLQAVLLIPPLLLLLILLLLGVTALLQGIVNWLITIANQFSSARSGHQPMQSPRQLVQLKNSIQEGKSRVMRSNLLGNLLTRLNPASNDIIERSARFLKIASHRSQKDVFDQIEIQYPKGTTVFIALPMDMSFMKLGVLEQSIHGQHDELLELAKNSNGQIIPFYAADPRHDDIVDRARNNLAKNKFRGIKIYPNLGYPPDHHRLLEIYKICIGGGFPVMTHCSPGGVWQYGLNAKERRAFSHPNNYKRILDQEEYRNLKLCLAHFGGAEEWIKHLKGRTRPDDIQEAWVNIVSDMIASGRYPNLYTDISYTVFIPKVRGLFIDLVDYLKVLLSHPLIKKRVLFGSDYYMVERENVSEKEISILLRSRLGEDLYKQITYTNPREFLGIETPFETA